MRNAGNIVDFVVNHEILCVETSRKPPHQLRHYIRLWIALREIQTALHLTKAKKLLPMVPFVVYGPVKGDKIHNVRMGDIVQGSSAALHCIADKSVDYRAFARIVRKINCTKRLVRPEAAYANKPSPYTASMLHVGLHITNFLP